MARTLSWRKAIHTRTYRYTGMTLFISSTVWLFGHYVLGWL